MSREDVLSEDTKWINIKAHNENPWGQILISNAHITSNIHLKKYLTDALYAHVFTDNSSHVTI